MQNNIIDIIISIYRRLNSGEELTEIKPSDFSKYQNNEFIAAYSFVADRKTSQEQNKANKSSIPRVLHLAEKLIITPDAYGFLLEILKIKLISVLDMELIIEQTMLNAQSRVGLEQMKSLVAKHLFKTNAALPGANFNLTGKERIN